MAVEAVGAIANAGAACGCDCMREGARLDNGAHQMELRARAGKRLTGVVV